MMKAVVLVLCVAVASGFMYDRDYLDDDYMFLRQNGGRLSYGNRLAPVYGMDRDINVVPVIGGDADHYFARSIRPALPVVPAVSVPRYAVIGY